MRVETSKTKRISVNSDKIIEGFVDTLYRLKIVKAGIARFFLNVDLRLYFIDKAKTDSINR
jgi:hypothetical protein